MGAMGATARAERPRPPSWQRPPSAGCTVKVKNNATCAQRRREKIICYCPTPSALLYRDTKRLDAEREREGFRSRLAD
jgi:hypothetical protein